MVAYYDRLSRLSVSFEQICGVLHITDDIDMGNFGQLRSYHHSPSLLMYHPIQPQWYHHHSLFLHLCCHHHRRPQKQAIARVSLSALRQHGACFIDLKYINQCYTTNSSEEASTVCTKDKGRPASVEDRAIFFASGRLIMVRT